MSTSRDCARFWLEGPDDGADPDSIEQQARAAHLSVCEDCREEMKGIVVQRATVRGGVRSSEIDRPLSRDLVARCVNAMVRAARDEKDLGRSAG